MFNLDLSLIIPCYNEEGNVEIFFSEAQKTFEDKGISLEYVFVNDGSTDKTDAKLQSIFDSNPNVNITVVNFSRNFGKEAAIFAGLQNSNGNATCIIDADLQQKPQTALEMFNLLKNNDSVDCVCAYQKSRNENKFMSAMKHIFYKTMNRITETEIKDGASDFRVFNVKVKEAILSLGEYHRFSKGIFSWVGFNTEFVEYQADERQTGETKWSFGKLFRYAITGIVAFSTAPLKFAIYIGFASTLFSVIYGIITVIRKLTANISVDGFTQLVILIVFFSGVLLFTVGIIGEYIAKIYQQVKNRPIYIVKDIVKRNEKD